MTRPGVRASLPPLLIKKAMFTAPDHLRTWAEIDLAALRENLAFIRKHVGPDPEILAVVKANGYGHGAREMVKALAHETAIFGVANVNEAREVSAAATGRDIMLLSPCLPGERHEAVKENYIVTASSAAEAREYAALGATRLNFKIDTGMGRVGCWWEEAPEEARRVAEISGISLHSISTHLPCADDDLEFTSNQLDHFFQLSAALRRLLPAVKVHSLNSAGILAFQNHSADIVRPGLILYGVSPVEGYSDALKPVLSWKARVALIKNLPAGTGVSYGRTFITPSPLRTAVIAVGYADGFPRQSSGRGASVLIHGCRCPVIGRVTMDQIVVDISAVDGVKDGDEAVLIGRQGEHAISANDLAEQSGTIAWDVLTGIGRRVERFYSGAAANGL